MGGAETAAGSGDLIEIVTQAIAWMGYGGVALLMFIETLIPPIPSELIMPVVGVAAARGELSIAGAVASAVAGATAGATAWYGLARAIGRTRLIGLAGRHGRWIGLSAETVERATAWFARSGGGAVFAGRLLAGTRVYVSVPAGLADMGMVRFLIFTGAGFTIWYGFLGLLGFGLGATLDPRALWFLALGGLAMASVTTLILRRVRR